MDKNAFLEALWGEMLARHDKHACSNMNTRYVEHHCQAILANLDNILAYQDFKDAMVGTHAGSVVPRNVLARDILEQARWARQCAFDLRRHFGALQAHLDATGHTYRIGSAFRASVAATCGRHQGTDHLTLNDIISDLVRRQDHPLVRSVAETVRGVSQHAETQKMFVSLDTRRCHCCIQVKDKLYRYEEIPIDAPEKDWLSHISGFMDQPAASATPTEHILTVLDSTLVADMRRFEDVGLPAYQGGEISGIATIVAIILGAVASGLSAAGSALVGICGRTQDMGACVAGAVLTGVGSALGGAAGLVVITNAPNKTTIKTRSSGGRALGIIEG